MKLAGYRLRQRDGVSCGPTVAVVSAALLDRSYRSALEAGPAWFDAEQARVHRRVNRLWPRRLGMTPAGLVAALAAHAPLPYRWRVCLGRRDPLDDVAQAVARGFPVPMLIGRYIPRHWVLLVEPATVGGQMRCYEPSSGALRPVDLNAVRRARLTGLGYPRAFAFVVPRSGTRCVA